MQDHQTILTNLVAILDRYSKTYRATTQPTKLGEYQANFDLQYNHMSNLIRESLLEHVGSLPIIASYLHPYIESKVDLGVVLKMLAIHDIGEIEDGDVNTFLKTDQHRQSEKLTALKYIHPSQHKIFLEFEDLQSNEAKFAKSVDKIAPDFIDYMLDAEYTIARFKSAVGIEAHEIVPKVRLHKSKFMQWDGFLKSFHEYLMEVTEEKINSHTLN